jgi:hypothetical protein
MLFRQQSLFQLWSHPHFLSHTLMGSIYLCYVDFSLVAFGNGIMTKRSMVPRQNESLLWCTHGWAARHALVSWLIVVIHYETILMCYILWTFSHSDRCILSQHATIFYPNLSPVSCQIPSHEFASIFSQGVTCFSTLKDPHPGRDSFKGGRLWHPRCQFRVTLGDLSLTWMLSENFLFLDRVYLCLSGLFLEAHRSRSYLIARNIQFWSVLKLLFLEPNANSKNHSRIILLIWSSLNQTLDSCYLIWAWV